MAYTVDGKLQPTPMERCHFFKVICLFGMRLVIKPMPTYAAITGTHKKANIHEYSCGQNAILMFGIFTEYQIHEYGRLCCDLI